MRPKIHQQVRGKARHCIIQIQKKKNTSKNKKSLIPARSRDQGSHFLKEKKKWGVEGSSEEKRPQCSSLPNCSTSHGHLKHVCVWLQVMYLVNLGGFSLRTESQQCPRTSLKLTFRGIQEQWFKSVFKVYTPLRHVVTTMLKISFFSMAVLYTLTLFVLCTNLPLKFISKSKGTYQWL